MKRNVPVYTGQLRKHMIIVPPELSMVSGICIFGKLIKSLVFSTDVAIIRNINTDAVIAVYPFTPQPAITHSIIMAAEMPVFCGVGGGTTKGRRVINLAQDAEFQGAMGVVLNAPTPNETLEKLSRVIDIPIVITVVSEYTDVASRLKAGASILNVSGAGKTPLIVDSIRKKFPDVPIIATGGSTPESIRQTIDAGANAITYTPPTTGELFRDMMVRYREDCEEKNRDILSKPEM